MKMTFDKEELQIIRQLLQKEQLQNSLMKHAKVTSLLEIVEEAVKEPFVYKVVGGTEVEFFNSVEELFVKYECVGIVESPSVREELRGQPRLDGLYGAMYDGMKDGKHVIRYETPETYKSLSY